MKNKEWNVEIVDECESTNSEVKLLKAKGRIADRTALMTFFQLNGRGQGKNTWHSSRGENLLVSFYRKLELPVSKNFMLTVIASIAIYRCLKKYHINCKIKWPNDIYYGDNKIAGVLIENSLMRSVITDTIMGVGLNVNEQNFPDWVSNPCSMLQIIEKKNKPEKICQEIANQIETLFCEYEKDDGMEIYHSYIKLLFRINHWHLFKKDDITFNGRIHGVESDGRLILETEGGRLLHLTFGEIEYVI